MNARLGRRLTLGLLVALSATSAWGREVERQFKPIPRGEAKALRIEIPAGEVELTPSAGSELLAELVLDCIGKLEPCEKNARAIRIASKREGETQAVGLTQPDRYGKKTRTWFVWSRGWSFETPTKKRVEGRSRFLKTYGWTLSARLVLRCPSYESVEVLLGEGALSAAGVTSPLSVRLLKGTVSLSAPADSVRSVHIDIGRGSGVLKPLTGRALRAKTIDWADGTGSNDLSVQIDKGAATVSLY